MGASGWAYLAQYQVDLNQALETLREVVFQSGEYFTEAKFLAMVIENTQESMSPEALRPLQDRLAELENESQPRTIQELLQMNGENGTHSIIDIKGVAETSEFGKVAPLSSQQLMKFFGTERPTREMAEEKLDEIENLCQRGEGVYFVVFQNGSPSEICFIGISGD
jgi:hypothetical protein